MNDDVGDRVKPSEIELHARRLVGPSKNAMVELHTTATIAENPCGGAPRYRLPFSRPMMQRRNDGTAILPRDIYDDSKIYGEDIEAVVDKSPEVRRAQTLLYNRVLGYGWMVTRDGKPLDDKTEKEIHGYLENHHTKFMHTVLRTLDNNGICFVRCCIVNGRTITTVPLIGTYDAYCFHKSTGVLGYEVEYRQDKIRHTAIYANVGAVPILDPMRAYRRATLSDIEEATSYYNSIIDKPAEFFNKEFRYDTGDVDMLDTMDPTTNEYITVVNKINVLFLHTEEMSLYDMTFVIVREAPSVDFMSKNEESGARINSRVARCVEDVHILRQIVRDTSFASGYNSRGRFAINEDPQYELGILKSDNIDRRIVESAMTKNLVGTDEVSAEQFMDNARKLSAMRANVDPGFLDPFVRVGDTGDKKRGRGSELREFRMGAESIPVASSRTYDFIQSLPSRGVGPDTGALNADVRVDKSHRVQPLNSAALKVEIESFRLAMSESIANEFGVPLAAISTSRSQSHVTSAASIFQNQTLEDTIVCVVREVKNITGFILNLLHRQTRKIVQPASIAMQIIDPPSVLYTANNDSLVTRTQARLASASFGNANTSAAITGSGGAIKNLFDMGCAAVGISAGYGADMAKTSIRGYDARDGHRNEPNHSKPRTHGPQDIPGIDPDTGLAEQIQPTIGQLDDSDTKKSDGVLVAYPTPRPIIPIETIIMMRDNGLLEHSTAALLCTSVLGLDYTLAKTKEPIWMSEEFIRESTLDRTAVPSAKSSGSAKNRPSAEKKIKKPAKSSSSSSEKSGNTTDTLVREVSRSVGLVKAMP